MSPLKALAVDVERNLRAPLTGISQVAAARGDRFAALAIAVRSGDTPAAERARFQREPAGTGMGRRYALEGNARPGDVLALAGGALMYDVNGNGLADGWDAPVLGSLVDVRG